MPIFLIEELWTDPMENEASAASGYKTVGYVESKDRAKKICADSGYVVGDGWPLIRGNSYPKRRSREVKKQ